MSVPAATKKMRPVSLRSLCAGLVEMHALEWGKVEEAFFS